MAEQEKKRVRGNPAKLKPLGSDPSRAEHDREVRRKGQLAQRAVLQKRRKLKEIMEDVMFLSCTSKVGKELAEMYGIDPEEALKDGKFTNALALILSISTEAIENRSVEAAKFVRSTLGEDPVHSMQVTTGEIGSADLKAISDAELVEMANRLETEAKEQGKLPDGGSPLLLPEGGNPDGSASEGN